MSSRFIKFIPSEKSESLMRDHPKAFILLSFIAMRARRIACPEEGLMEGDAWVGDYESMGLSRQEYRTALDVLVEKKMVEIKQKSRVGKVVKKPKNLAKSATIKTTIKTTIKDSNDLTIRGVVVNITDSSIYDINKESANHQIYLVDNHQPNQQNNHKQERNKKENKKENNNNPYPFKKIVVVAFYECLKELEIPDEDKKALMNFSEERVELAVDYVKHPEVKIKKDLTSALIWHCKQTCPPKVVESNRMTEQQHLALKFIKEIKDIGGPCYEEQNKKFIPEHKMLIFHLGQPQSISLRNPVEVLKSDFNLAKSEIFKFEGVVL